MLSLTFNSLTYCDVMTVEMVYQEEMVRMESQEHKENRDHLDLKEFKDLHDLGVLESPTSGGERVPVLTLMVLNYSMLEELGGVLTTKMEEERGFVCFLTQTSVILDQLLQAMFLLFMEQNGKLTIARFIIFLTTTSPVLSAMPPPELQ